MPTPPSTIVTSRQGSFHRVEMALADYQLILLDYQHRSAAQQKQMAHMISVAFQSVPTLPALFKDVPGATYSGHGQAPHEELSRATGLIYYWVKTDADTPETHKKVLSIFWQYLKTLRQQYVIAEPVH